MGRPQNGIYIIQGEISLVVTAMKRSSRWVNHTQQDEESDPLLSSFSQLKDILNNISDLDEIEPNAFLGPFLEVIRSEDTTGPITGLALTSVNKFLSYGLVDSACETAPAAIENIADAVTHARFVGTDPGSDEVVLMKILHVLRTLLLAPAGVLLTNESVCEIMQSCFRICFEMRLSELLRKSAEHTLMDMVQLLFSRLPQFKEDPKWVANMKKLKMRTGGVDPSRMGRKKRSPKPRPKRPKSKQQDNTAGTIQECENVSSSREDVSGGQDPPQDSIVSEGIEYVQASKERLATTPATPGEDGVIDISQRFQEATDKEKQAAQISEEISELQIDDSSTEIDKDCFSLQSESSNISLNMENSGSTSQVVLSVPQREDTSQKGPDMLGTCGDMDRVSLHSEDTESVHSTAENSEPMVVDEIVNPQGVRFTPHHHHKEGSGPLLPYGLPCVRELFRFLISLTNPLDRHNTDVMIHMGLSLLSVALESGADHIGHYNSLLYLVKDEMCRHLFLLLQSERLSLFSASLRVCFLLFESIRSHLKLQLEFYLTKLTDIIVSESPRISYEIREIALESIVQLWRIPGLVTELYLNYDCDLYCSNLFEDLTKLLSKNAFPVQGLFSTHLLSLDALLTVVDSIEQHCHSRILSINKQGAEGRQTVQSSQTVTENGVLESSVPSPPTTGYVMAQKLLNKEQTQESSKEEPKQKDTAKRSPSFRQNRMKVSSTIPTAEDIATIKHKKKLYYTGTEQFNTKPSKGITYLQEQGLLSDPLDPGEVVTFLKENPRLDKAMIGEYVAKKTNSKVLEAFVKSFNFEDLRVDEALRQYLEAFRLPGEAPVISYLIEHFSDHWHKSNGEPFANADAAFTLTYAIIMLNVDQHNHNAKKQNIPMTGAEFKKNLKKCNGGADFDQDMLEEIYVAIKNEEIVMPAEHTGLVKENYLWKVLLRRGTTKDGLFLHVPSGSFDHDLFTLIWGPTVAALSFVFDKSSDDSIIQKAIAGFRKCAMISAHYGMSDVFDNLVISLCKFTTLLSSVESPEHIPVMFGSNSKAQLAARTVFGLAHRHGDILREGWKNILDCMLQLYRAKLLPKGLTEVEDFIDTSGKICIVREETTAAQRSEGVLSSFYSYFTSSEPTTNKGPTPEEQEASKQAQSCIRDCHLEQLILDSKFLREDSLQELIKAQIFASQGPEVHNSELQFDEDAAVFFLELLIKVILQNRDRVVPIWQNVRDHLYSLIVNSNECTFLVERAVVGLLRLAIRLLRREEVAPQVLTSLRILLMMKPTVIHSCTRQISYALHELLRTNAANIHTSQDWFTLFTLLEVVGAGANPPPLLQVCPGIEMSEAIIDAGAQSDSELPSTSVNDNLSDRGYTSDSEISYVRQAAVNRSPSPLEIRPIPDNGSWLLVNKDSHQPIGEDHTSVTIPKVIPNQYSIELNEDLHYCDSKALLKSSETLAFLVRDAAHVTPLNFESCVHSIRAFVEASVNGGRRRMPAFPRQQKPQSKHVHKKSKKDTGKMKKSSSSPSHIQSIFPSDDEGEEEGTGGSLASLSIQLLDLMHTLHTRAATIFTSWAEEENNEEREAIDACHSALWVKCWCPLLQGIARLCCDTRRQVRSQALTYLQRALLVHDLQTLSAAEWEACFNKVLFPLLTKLLENINVQDPSGMEETRMRASTLLCKVFLQHLSPLLSLSTFTALWLTILDFMDKYMHTDNSDLLSEAIPESLKNMLLVMDTANIFHTSDGGESQLWKLTWDRIDTFLPHLQKELFKPKNSEETPVISSQPVPSTTAPVAQTLHEQQSTAESPPSQIPPEVPLEGITVVKEHSHDYYRGSSEEGDSPSPQPHMALSHYLSQPYCSSVGHHPHVSVHKSHINHDPPVPLLLHPDIMPSAPIQFVTSQESHETVQSRPPVIENP